MTLQLFHSEFPYTVYGEILIFFFISVCSEDKDLSCSGAICLVVSVTVQCSNKVRPREWGYDRKNSGMLRKFQPWVIRKRPEKIPVCWEISLRGKEHVFPVHGSFSTAASVI
jgi:hypothetical protein